MEKRPEIPVDEILTVEEQKEIWGKYGDIALKEMREIPDIDTNPKYEEKLDMEDLDKFIEGHKHVGIIFASREDADKYRKVMLELDALARKKILDKECEVCGGLIEDSWKRMYLIEEDYKDILRKLFIRKKKDLAEQIAQDKNVTIRQGYREVNDLVESGELIELNRSEVTLPYDAIKTLMPIKIGD